MTKYHSSKFFQLITLIVISSMCLLLDTLTKIHFSHSSLPRNSPEYTAYGADGEVFDHSGKLLYRVVSYKAWKYPNDQKIYLKKVQIYFYDKKSDAITYHISGDDGWMDEGNKMGLLGKNVVAVISGDKKTSPITFYGNQVHIDMKKNLFTSNNDVKAVQAKSILTAHGFSYNSDQEFLILNSKVRVFYVK